MDNLLRSAGNTLFGFIRVGGGMVFLGGILGRGGCIILEGRV